MQKRVAGASETADAIRGKLDIPEKALQDIAKRLEGFFQDSKKPDFYADKVIGWLQLGNVSASKIANDLKVFTNEVHGNYNEIDRDLADIVREIYRRIGSFNTKGSISRKGASENTIYQLIDYDGDTILTHTLVGREHIIKNASGKVVAKLPIYEDGSDFAYNKVVLGDKAVIAEVLGAIVNNSFVANKITIKER